MRNKTSLLALAMALTLGFGVSLAAPAFANVDIDVNVRKDKDIQVLETITKNKTVVVTIDNDLVGKGAAEAQALANILNGGAGNDGSPNEVNLEDSDQLADLTDSVERNIGVTQVSQAAGNMQNQGNILATAVSDSGEAFVDAQAEVDQKNLGDNGGINGDRETDIDNSLFTSSTVSSVTGNEGVTQVNQDSGNMNNQTNAVAVAAGIDNAANQAQDKDVTVALSEAALGQENVGHVIDANGNASSSTLTSGSVVGNAGVTHVNQSSGNFANQANVTAIGAAVAQFDGSNQPI